MLSERSSVRPWGQPYRRVIWQSGWQFPKGPIACFAEQQRILKVAGTLRVPSAGRRLQNARSGRSRPSNSRKVAWQSGWHFPKGPDRRRSLDGFRCGTRRNAPKCPARVVAARLCHNGGSAFGFETLTRRQLRHRAAYDDNRFPGSRLQNMS